jgi:hypothetical protein
MAGDEEEDYMSMVFEDAPKKPTQETSLQRAARKRREVCFYQLLLSHQHTNQT